MPNFIIPVSGKRLRNTVPACILLRITFWNGVPAHSVTKIPLVLLYPEEAS
jgi:hypothetical protein